MSPKVSTKSHPLRMSTRSRPFWKIVFTRCHCPRNVSIPLFCPYHTKYVLWISAACRNQICIPKCNGYLFSSVPPFLSLILRKVSQFLRYLFPVITLDVKLTNFIFLCHKKSKNSIWDKILVALLVFVSQDWKGFETIIHSFCFISNTDMIKKTSWTFLDFIQSLLIFVA